MSRRGIVFVFFIISSALLGLNLPPLAHAADVAPISTESVTINLGYPLLAPTWGSTIVTRAKLWKKYLPNVEVNREDFMSGMPVVNNMVAGKIDIGYFADMPAIALASKANLT
jgi:ABC-type nitrate/sulfonate/bicarbonate transport system substrate-binding protein